MKFDFSRITDNWLLKVIALILAIFIWGVAVTNTQINSTEDTISMIVVKTVESRNLSYDLKQVEDPIDVTIQLLVPKAQQNIINDDVIAFVDLSGKGAGQHNIPIEVVCPQGVEVVRISPSRHVVELKGLVSKDFAVELGFEANVTFTPDTARIEATEETLNSINRVLALIVEDNNSTVANLVAVDSQGKEVEGINIYPESVVVEILPVYGEYLKKVPIHANIELKDESLLIKEIEIYPKEVLIAGKKEALDSIDSISTSLISVSADVLTYSGKLNISKDVFMVEDVDEVIITIVFESPSTEEALQE